MLDFVDASQRVLDGIKNADFLGKKGRKVAMTVGGRNECIELYWMYENGNAWRRS